MVRRGQVEGLPYEKYQICFILFKAICKIFSHLLEHALWSVLVKSEFKYLK